MGVGTFPTYNTGENVYIADGPRSTFSDTSPLGTAPPDPLVVGDLAPVVAQLDELSKEVPVDAPWTAEKAREYDGQTLDTWIKANTNPVARQRFEKLVNAATRPIFGAEPTEISLLFTLFYIAASGNEQNAGTFERNFNTRDGAQESRFVGGSGRSPRGCAGARPAGDPEVAGPADPQRRARRVVISDRINVRAKRVIVRDPAGAGRPDRLHARPAARARRAAPAAAAGNAGQGRRGLRHAVLAREGPDRHGAQHRRQRQRDVRRLAARRLARRPVRLRRRRRAPHFFAMPRRPSAAPPR